MKLAEALLLRSDLQKKLASLRERIKINALLQEGEDPHEDPEELIEQAFAVLDQMQPLVIAINEANLAGSLPDGCKMNEALAERNCLMQKHSVLQAAVSAMLKENDRYSMREIKWVAAVSVKDLQKQSEKLAKQTRELNAKIQETNWQIIIDYEN